MQWPVVDDTTGRKYGIAVLRHTPMSSPGKIIPFQLPLQIAEAPAAAKYRRRLAAAKSEAEVRTIAEEIIRDYEAERAANRKRWDAMQKHIQAIDRFYWGED